MTSYTSFLSLTDLKKEERKRHPSYTKIYMISNRVVFTFFRFPLEFRFLWSGCSSSLPFKGLQTWKADMVQDSEYFWISRMIYFFFTYLIFLVTLLLLCWTDRWGVRRQQVFRAPWSWEGCLRHLLWKHGQPSSAGYQWDSGNTHPSQHVALHHITSH